MAPINDGIPHVHSHPGSKSTNLRETKIHSSKRPYDAVCVLARKSNSALLAGNDTTNGTPTPPPPPPPASEDNGSSEIVNTSPGPDDTDGDGMSTLEKMLSPPEFDAKSVSKNQDVKVFSAQWQPHIRVGPIFPQPPNPSKEKKSAFNSRRNRISKRRKTLHSPRANSSDVNDGDDADNDGDDEGDESPDTDDPITLISVKSNAATHLDPPTTPRRVLRSQAIDQDPDSPTPSPRTLAPNPKRKRADSKTDPATPTRGQRVSKRQRNSLGDSSLPLMQTVKHTRAEQKKFESKLDHLIYDPERPGSVEREVVEIKSGAKEWRRALLHDELWDGNSKPE